MLLVLSLTYFALAVGVLLVWTYKKHNNFSSETLKTKEYRAKVKSSDESPHAILICDKEQDINASGSQAGALWLARYLYPNYRD